MELFNCKKIQQQYSPDCSGKTTGEQQKFPTHIDGSDSLIYICDGQNWYEASKTEEMYGICDSTKNKQKVKVEEQYFYCLNGVWRNIGYNKFHEDCWDPELVNANDTSFQDCRDGKTYKTVKIGNQVWMAENLNYESENSFCYNDSVEYCAEYGRLYTWESAMQACPPGLKWFTFSNRKNWFFS